MSYIAPQTRTYLFLTIDPLHVGAGGTRLGRVDNTVCRDPATGLPKVPGSGLSGAVKDAYDLATLVARQRLSTNEERSRSGRPENQRCAGTKGCGNPKCKVCRLFGTAPGDEGGSSSNNRAERGLIAFRDATMAAIPLASVTGPIWFLDHQLAQKLGLLENIDNNAIQGLPDPNVVASPTLQNWDNAQINIGPFLFPIGGRTQINSETIELNVDFLPHQNRDQQNGNLAKLTAIADRSIVGEESLWPILSAAAMEVRTSVSIDPDTGAAAPKKLFSLEAVPAGTLFKVDLTFLGGKIPDAFGDGATAETLFREIETYAFPYLAFNGLGGNVTRGFGRVRFLGALSA